MNFKIVPEFERSAPKKEEDDKKSPYAAITDFEQQNTHQVQYALQDFALLHSEPQSLSGSGTSAQSPPTKP